MSLLPIRSRTLHFVSTMDKVCVDDLIKGLKADYGNERQFTKTNFSNHLLNLEANGLLDEVNYDLDKDGQLRVYYKINDEGINTVNRYLPKKWRITKK
jgi:DNA-binding transcriptional ArsR family regulator